MTTSNQNKKSLVSPKELLLGIIERQDYDALHDWVLVHVKVNIPREVITPGHKAPFDFVADYLFGKISFAVVLANRSGGKTYIFGVLATILSYLFDDTEIATVGAIQQQALKSYEYFQTFGSLFPFAYNVESSTMRESKLKNKSKYQVLAGTMSGVNSPHPQLLFIDEIDLMVWQVLQQALSMPQSKKTVKARTVLTSTRKFAGGVMQRMLDEAKNRQYQVYKWNIWEVVAPLPTDDPELMERIRKVFGAELPRDIHKADGYYQWEDLIIKRLTLDDEVWQTEWLCSRPGLEGIIYGKSYSDENNLITEWTPPDRGYIYLAEDFGHSESHPNVLLAVWIPTTFDRLVVFDEIFVDDFGVDDIWLAGNDMLGRYGHVLPDKRSGVKGTIRGWATDPHNLALIHERAIRGAPLLPKNEDASLYQLTNSIPIVRKFLQSGRLMITENCTNLRTEFLSYQWKKNADGTYSRIPKKENDHGLDAIRYLLLCIGDQIERNWLQRTYYKKGEKVEETPQKETERPYLPGKSGKNPVTGGMLDMKF